MSCVITPAVAAGKMGAFDALGGPFVQFCVVLMKAFPPAPVQEVAPGGERGGRGQQVNGDEDQDPRRGATICSIR
jgi:hypothetical protein